MFRAVVEEAAALGVASRLFRRHDRGLGAASSRRCLTPVEVVRTPRCVPLNEASTPAGVGSCASRRAGR